MSTSTEKHPLTCFTKVSWRKFFAAADKTSTGKLSRQTAFALFREVFQRDVLSDEFLQEFLDKVLVFDYDAFLDWLWEMRTFPEASDQVIVYKWTEFGVAYLQQQPEEDQIVLGQPSAGDIVTSTANSFFLAKGTWASCIQLGIVIPLAATSVAYSDAERIGYKWTELGVVYVRQQHENAQMILGQPSAGDVVTPAANSFLLQKGTWASCIQLGMVIPSATSNIEPGVDDKVAKVLPPNEMGPSLISNNAQSLMDGALRLLKELPVEDRDPRWDIDGFNDAFNKVDIGWLHVGYLRQTVLQGGILPRRRDTPPEGLHIGSPPKSVQLYCLDYCWETKAHPDPKGTRLKLLVEALDVDGAFDDDLVLWDWACVWLLDDKERALAAGQFEAWSRYANTHFRIKSIVLPDAPVEERSDYYSRLWCLHGFSLSTFTQRIANSSRPAVSSHMTPEWLLQTEAKLEDAFCFHQPDRMLIRRIRATLRQRLEPARSDAVGFRTVCAAANFRWVLVSFIHTLAARGKPAPRRQEMPPGTYIDGIVPAGCQPWVVSYGWAAVEHFSPSGAKICELSQTLAALGAKQTDVVFLDHMSLWQKGRTLPKVYAIANNVVEQMVDYRNGRVTQADMTKAQGKEMRFALYESTRLYAFAGGVLPSGEPVLGCKVVVLPRVEAPSSFPDHGELTLKMNTFCHPPREEYDSNWGFCKSLKYHQGGWTCAEYSVARKNGTIANATDPDVVAVDGARTWPKNVTAYAEMMDENSVDPVAFANYGDREAVRFNFFKYAYAFCETEAANNESRSNI